MESGKKKKRNWWLIVILSIIIVVFAVVATLAILRYREAKQVGSSNGNSEVVMPQFDFPDGDNNPAHMADVLGSEEAYQNLVNLNILRDSPEMEIKNDPGNPIYGIPSTSWVVAYVRGYVIDISLAEQTITISYEGDEITFQPSSPCIINIRVGISSTPAKFDEIVKGDYVRLATIYINSTNLDLPQTRMMAIVREETSSP